MLGKVLGDGVGKGHNFGRTREGKEGAIYPSTLSAVCNDRRLSCIP
jgi:hypothetical protein